MNELRTGYDCHDTVNGGSVLWTVPRRLKSFPRGQGVSAMAASIRNDEQWTMHSLEVQLLFNIISLRVFMLR